MRSSATLERVAELIGCVTLWPAWAQRLAQKPQLRCGERYALTVFLLENGLPPLVLAEYLVAEPSMLRDERARLDVDALLRKFRAGTLGGGVFFDLATRDYLPLHGALGRPRGHGHKGATVTELQATSVSAATTETV